MTTVAISSGTTTLSANTSNNYFVYGTGEVVVAAGVTASGFITAGDDSAPVAIQINGTSSNSVVQTGAFETVAGTAHNVVVDGGWEEAQGATYNSLIINGGTEQVFGGQTYYTTVGNNGTQQVYYSAIPVVQDCFYTTIESGGTQTIFDGWAFGATVQAGGLEEVKSGDHGGGTAEFSTVLAGGILNVYATGLSEFADIYGFEDVNSGGNSQDSVQRGGSLTVESGGFSSGGGVHSGGSEYVYGTDNGNFIFSGGVEYIETGGTANGTHIGQGATLDLVTGSRLGSASFAGVGGLLVIEGTQMPTGTISGFVPGDTIQLSDVAYDGSGSASLNGNVLAVQENGVSYNLNLTPTPGYTYYLQNDHGTTDILAHLATATSDFNDDGTSDVLFRDDNGHVVTWDMKTTVSPRTILPG